MKPEDEVIQLQAEKQALQEQLAQRDELIAALLKRVQVLEERLVKDSHNSHLPPSSDRFVRQPKSLRSKSGKKSGGQKGHRGQRLPLSTSVDEVIVKAVERCEHCGEDLREVGASQVERRQVIDLPEPRLHIWEYQAEQKSVPTVGKPAKPRSLPKCARRCNTGRGSEPWRSIWSSSNCCPGNGRVKCCEMSWGFSSVKERCTL